jgi:hypothetical protein
MCKQIVKCGLLLKSGDGWQYDDGICGARYRRPDRFVLMIVVKAAAARLLTSGVTVECACLSV